MSDALLQYYHKYAPRWFKVIRWREAGARFVENQKWTIPLLLIPFAGMCFFNNNPMAAYLYFKRPQTKEELALMQRNWKTFMDQRNWEMDQYQYNVPPVYDLWERRRQYPEYYAGRYDGFYRDGHKVGKKVEGQKNFRVRLVE